MALADWFNNACFRVIHGNNLVYNTCWEDPRIDRQALALGPTDVVAVITSAGCNVLDYALEQPRRIFAIDMNPRQNALLELKIAGIRSLDYPAFFALFGQGKHRDALAIYRQRLRPLLSTPARCYWDRHMDVFVGAGRRGSFYFHGTTGLLAWAIKVYIDQVAKIRGEVEEFLAADNLSAQQAIYRRRLEPVFWSGLLRWAMDRNLFLALLGVPRAQRIQVETSYPGGIVRFIQDRIEAVFTRLPFQDNYFWRVYLTGAYTSQCCPEYLQPENFARLKAGLVDRIHVRTGTFLDFLKRYTGQITRYVLLDHMDWLSSRANPILVKQWQTMIDRASPNARFLWRSGGERVDFIDPIEVKVGGTKQRLGEVLTYHREWADRLHQQDRVHTYGSFSIADLAA